jgi:hypothetical protein
MLPEVTGEHVAGARTDTIRVRHDESVLLRVKRREENDMSDQWTLYMIGCLLNEIPVIQICPVRVNPNPDKRSPMVDP